jgi:hypothetical protein
MYKDIKALYVVDLYLNKEEIYFLEKNFDKVYFSVDGEIITSSGEILDVFDEFNPDLTYDYLLSKRKNELWKYDIDSNVSRKIFSFNDDIVAFFDIDDSESIIVLFDDYIGVVDFGFRIFTKKDSGSQAFISRNGKIVIWRQEGVWRKYNYF